MKKANNYVVRCKKSVTDICKKGEYFKGIEFGFSKSLKEVYLFWSIAAAHDVVLHDYFDEHVTEDAFYKYFEILPVEVTLIGEEK